MTGAPRDASPRAAAWMLVPASRERFDGIRDYAANLAAALTPDQPVVTWTTRDDAHPSPSTRVIDSWSALEAEPARPGALYLNYQPQAWLRRDLWPLLRALRAMRAAGTRVIVVVHEYQLDPAPGVRRAAGRFVFLALARALARRADALVATHEFVATWLREDGLADLAPVKTIPVGSNVPDGVRRDRIPGRVVMFGQAAGMQAEGVRAASRALRAAGKPALVWICRDRDEARQWLAANGIEADGIEVRASLDAGSLASELASASVALAPIVDGVSTRRTTVIACLQYGLPIAGTRGRATDPLFGASAAFALSPLDDAEGLARTLVGLLDDGSRREAMSRSARQLFDAQLAWPRIARHFLELAS